MVIHFKCKCGHTLQIAEDLLLNNPQSYRYCLCGGKLSIVNTCVDEIVKDSLEEQVRDRVTQFFKSEGVEGGVELIKRTRKTMGEKIYSLYKVELQRRGLSKI